MRRPVYLALGTNLGNREENLLKAVQLLDEYFDSPSVALSSFYRTEACGFEGPEFLNAAVRYDLDLDALEILHICKRVEVEMGRADEGIKLDPEGKRIYHSRIMDIDVLLVGDEQIDTPELKVPHPRMKERDFVMVPFREIFVGIV